MSAPIFGKSPGLVRTEIPGPNSRNSLRELTELEAPNITAIDPQFPIVWNRAHGSNVEDLDGNLFLDLTAAFGVAVLGHTHPSLVKAIEKQGEYLLHGMGDLHPSSPKISLLKKLRSIFPDPTAQVILGCTGSEAVEIALKTAQLATGKPEVLSFDDGYHGLSYGTLCVTGMDRFRTPFLMQLPKIRHAANFPKASQDESEDERRKNKSLKDLENILQKQGSRIGAVLVEPIQGRGGVILPPKNWLFALQELTHRYDALLIVDEIFTGFGRTGSLFAFEQEGLTPDLVCVGKALSGCLPISACIGKASVMKAWPLAEGEALHTSTFMGNPLASAAALGALESLHQEQLVQRSRDLGIKLLNLLEVEKSRVPMIKEVRGRGLMCGVELERGSEKGLGMRAAIFALQKGLILLPSGKNGNTISITPALNIEEELLAWGVSTLASVIESL